MRTVFVFVRCCLVLLLLGTADLASAQVLYDVAYRPPGIRYRVLTTPHFEVIFQEGLEEEAREAAAVLERTLPQAERLVGSRRRLQMPVVLNRYNDRGNGFVSPFPFRQEIEAVSLKGDLLSPRFGSWLEAVAPHELAHAVHADQGEGLGVGAAVRLFAPDLARSLNLTAPAGVNEGLAVYFESMLEEGAGRLNHSLFLMEARAAMGSDRAWSLAQLLEPPGYTRPFDRYYKGGAHFFQYLAEQDSARFFRRAADLHYRFPFLGYGLELWYGTGTFPYRLGRTFRRAARVREEARIQALGRLTDPTVVAGARGEVHRRPVWLDDTTLAAYVQGYSVRPGFYRIDAATGVRRPISHQRVTEDYQYSLTPDRRALLFSRYVPSTTVPSQARAEAFRLDLDSGEVERLTREGRVLAPVTAPGGGVWALQNDGQFNRWVRLEGGGVEPVSGSFRRALFKSLLPAPDGATTAVLLNVEGRQGLFRVERGSEGRPRVTPWVLFDGGSVYSASWSSDARYLLFSADPDGVANIYALDTEEERLYRLTNVPYGALEPSLSPDGRTLAFTNYAHERYDLVTLPFRPEAAEEVPRRRAAFGAALPWQRRLDDPIETAFDTAAVRPYRAWRHLQPRMLYPVASTGGLLDADVDRGLGLQAGLGIAGTDPLQRWSYTAEAFYQANRLWGSAALQTGRFLLRPALEVFDRPSTVVVEEGPEPAARRVGREMRGAALSLSAPFVLRSNVFYSYASFRLRGEVRQERLFGLDGGETLRDPRRSFLLTPAAQFGYRLQANPRDLVPNSGLSVRSSALLDLWAEAGAAARQALLTEGALYLPFLRGRNIGLALRGGLLTQNRGAVFNLDRFLPRGHEETFLGGGTFVRYGLDYTQPLWYIDDGFLLLPAYFKVLYGYAFAETLHPWEDWSLSVRRSSVGAGIGLQMRLWHLFDLEFRVGAAFLPEEGTLEAVYR